MFHGIDREYCSLATTNYDDETTIDENDDDNDNKVDSTMVILV